MKGIAAILVVLIFLPLLFFLVQDEQAFSWREKRVLISSPPPLPETLDESSKYTDDFEKYFNDQLGLRDSLIVLHHRMKRMLGLSPVESVVLGKDEWLFNNLNGVFEKYQQESSFTEEETKVWFDYISRRSSWADSVGVAYYFMPVPDKHAIYPEQINQNDRENIQKVHIHDLMKTLSTAGLEKNIVDIYPLMWKHRAHFNLPLFIPGDTHWNILGGSVATYGLVEKIQKRFPELKYSLPEKDDYEIGGKFGGELSAMIGGGDRYKTQQPSWSDPLVCVDKKVRAENVFGLNEKSRREGEQPHYLYCESGVGLKVLVFRDSFWEKLRSSLAPLFESTYVVKMEGESFFDDRVFKELVESYQPDIVIEQRVYRLLPRKPVSDFAAMLEGETFFEKPDAVINSVFPAENRDLVSVATPRHATPRHATQVRFRNPGWNTNLTYFIRECSKPCYFKITVQSEKPARARLSSLDASGVELKSENLILRKGKNDIYSRLDGNTETLVLDQWQAEGELDLGVKVATQAL